MKIDRNKVNEDFAKSAYEDFRINVPSVAKVMWLNSKAEQKEAAFEAMRKKYGIKKL